MLKNATQCFSLSTLSFRWRKKVIIDRIKEIANYQKISKKHKRNSIVILVFACVLVYCISPLLTVYASRDSSNNLTSQNIDDIDLSSYFSKTSGSFVIYDMTMIDTKFIIKI